MGQKRRVFVTGADGFVGRVVCRRLLDAGYIPRAALRSAALWDGMKAAVPGISEWMDVGDLGGEPVFSRASMNAFDGVEAVIHLAARVHVMKDDSADPLEEYRRTNVQGTVALVNAAAAAGVKHIVFISTVKVNGESTQDRAFTEEDVAAPQDPYGVSKWEAEEALRAVAAKTGLALTVVRPPLLYGPGVRANFLNLMKLTAKGIPLPLPETGNRRSLLGVENLADFLVRCVWHEKAAGQTFLLSDGKDLSTHQLVEQIAQAMGRKAHFLPISVGAIRSAARLLRKQAVVDRLFGSLAIDSSKARRLLEWAPPVPMQEGLAATARWFLSTGKK